MDIIGNVIVNPDHGETTWVLSSGADCGIRQDHGHCSAETCPQGNHGGAAHCLLYQQPPRDAALRVVKNEIRRFTFGAASAAPSIGEVEHIEAKGLIAIDSVPVRKQESLCARSEHRHVRNDSAATKIGQPASRWDSSLPADETMCVIAETYPVTLHLDLPLGDYIGGVALGDKLIVSIRRTETRIEGGLTTGRPAYELPSSRPSFDTAAVE